MKRENLKPEVKFILNEHAVKDEFFLTIKTKRTRIENGRDLKNNEDYVFWLTRKELLKLREMLKGL